MTHINIKISKGVATAEKDGIITTGMVGVSVSFMFDSWWDGLIVTAVFKGSGAPISVPLLGATETVVPWEVLKRPSTLLRIGAEGRLPDGTLVIPTTWATVGIVMSGANATDDLAKPPTPTAFDRIMSQIGNMNDLTTEDKSSLVAAVNEAMEKGGGVDVSGASVGQIIKVAAVDDTGKPTAWEPVDLPEQVQSDWEQNDAEQPNYVKNRPFYTSDTKIECYREQEITFDEEGIAGSLSSSDSDSYLSDGDTITVIVDGVPYSGKAYNSGPPFYEIWWKASPFSYDFRGVSCSDSSFYGKTVKIQIFKVETSIVKMDKQFLPPISVNDLDDFPETVGQKTDDLGEIFNAAKSAGWNAHAEGLGTIASGDRSHAEGYETIASGEESHAEGAQTTASGYYSHSEGGSTTASGMGSHAEGYETIASGYYSHVQGQFNVEDTENKYVHIVGNGTDVDKRSNAHTLDWEGNAWFAGEVKVGGTGQNDYAAKTLATTEDIPTVDSTLTQSSQAADAKAVGDRLSTLSEEIVTTSESKVSAHNTGADTHSDIRLLIQGLTDRLNALADSDDTTLDQLSEVVAYIKSNRDLISAITASKVNVADIVNNLTTNASNKPLSAAQGVAIKTLIDALRNDKLDAAELTNAINTALAQAKESGEFDGKSAYQYAQDGGYTGTEAEFAAKLAQEMPEALPNPNALTFTGAVTGTYDGSAPLEVEIPSGEGGTGGGGDVFELIGEATSSGVLDNVGLTIPFDGSLYKTIIAYAYNLPAGNNKRIIIRNKKVWYDGSPLGWNCVVDTYLASVTKMSNTWGFFGAAIDVDGKLFTFGAAEANTNSGHGYFRFFPQNGALPTLSLSDCKFISLDCNSNSEIIPDGCSLVVWGVRK